MWSVVLGQYGKMLFGVPQNTSSVLVFFVLFLTSRQHDEKFQIREEWGKEKYGLVIFLCVERGYQHIQKTQNLLQGISSSFFEQIYDFHTT